MSNQSISHCAPCKPLRSTRFPEQQKIADCLNALDALLTAQTQKIESLQTHKKGLMQKLFPTP